MKGRRKRKRRRGRGGRRGRGRDGREGGGGRESSHSIAVLSVSCPLYVVKTLHPITYLKHGPWSLNQHLSRDWSSRHHGQHHHPTWGQEQGTSTPLPESTQQCSKKHLSCPLPVAGIKSAQLLTPAQTYLNPGSFAVPLLLTATYLSSWDGYTRVGHHRFSCQSDILSLKCLVFLTDPNAVGSPCHLPARTSHLIRHSDNAPNWPLLPSPPHSIIPNRASEGQAPVTRQPAQALWPYPNLAAKTAHAQAHPIPFLA